MKSLMKIRTFLNSENILLKFPFLARYTSKYGSVPVDIESFIRYYLFSQRGVKKQKMRYLTIIPTTICNSKCVFCAYRFFKDKTEIMDFKLFKKIIKDYKKIGGGSVSLTPTQGDPLLDPTIIKKISYLNENQIDCEFHTNAILLDKYAKDLSKQNIKKIQLDLGDIIPKYDSQVFNISTTLSEKRLKNILKFLKAIKKSKKRIEIEISFKAMRDPKKIWKDFKKSNFYSYYKKKIIKVSFVQSFDNWGGLIKEKELKGIQKLKRPMRFKKVPCIHFNNLSILPNGDARICGCRCLGTLKDELVIGNLKKESLEEVTNSKKWEVLMSDFGEGKIPLVCKNCSFYRPLFLEKRGNK